MRRKRDPEQIYLAHRAVVLSLLTGSGAPTERAEALLIEWEDEAVARALPRNSATFWGEAVEWIAARWP
ncbi:MAG: hypothetical protein ACHQNA_05895 [Acidimicrobiales bacterium]